MSGLQGKKMKKIIRLEDLDIVKQQKEMEKKIDKALEKRCLICDQIMKHLFNFTWYCKRCDTLTTVEHVISFKQVEGDRRTRFIE